MTDQASLELLKTMSEESRLRIVQALISGERCACEIPELIGRTQSNTSMHLKKLLECNLVKARREGKKIHYSINDPRVCNLLVALGHSKEALFKECCCSNPTKKTKLEQK
jgi:ArsR family transcriptional regulator, lead/cadmium/zinc/bismuth-responsive transcriptional repressor